MSLQAHSLSQEEQNTHLLFLPWMQSCTHKTHKTKPHTIPSTIWLACSWKLLVSVIGCFRAIPGQPFFTLVFLLGHTPLSIQISHPRLNATYLNQHPCERWNPRLIIEYGFCKMKFSFVVSKVWQILSQSKQPFFTSKFQTIPNFS